MTLMRLVLMNKGDLKLVYAICHERLLTGTDLTVSKLLEKALMDKAYA